MSTTYNIPVWEKYTLTIEEAAAYFRIGEHKLRNLVNENKKAHKGETTACCREKCAGCGANKLNGGVCDEIGKTVV